MLTAAPAEATRKTAALALVITALSLPAHEAAAQEVSECLVHADEIARIGAPSRGVIYAIHVNRADAVTRGTIIAELEASDEESEVDLAQMRAASDIALRLARAKAETAELNAERLTTLVARNLVPNAEQEAAALEAQVARLEEEEAQYQRRLAELHLSAALAARERKRVRAPFDGVVTDLLISEGELYNEQHPIAVIARIDPLRVEAYLPAFRRTEVELGQKADVMLELGGRVTAEIILIDPVLDAATGTFGLELNLPNPDGSILAGQSCTLTLVTTN